MARDGVVLALVDSGQDVAALLVVGVDSVDLVCREIGQAKALEFARSIELLDCIERFLVRCFWIRGVEVVDVNLFVTCSVSLQLRAFLQLEFLLFRL